MDSQPLLDPAEAQFVQGGVSISVAARTADLTPVVSRAFGCRVGADRRQVTVFLSRAIAAAVISCLEDNGAIAAVFTLPSTHRTLKLKGSDATLVDFGPGDRRLIEDYRHRFALELATLGYTAEFQGAVVPMMPDLVAVRFTPSAAFDQTPGPDAGRLLGR